MFRYVISHLEHYASLLLGLGAYLAVWVLVFRKRWSGSWFSTLEHELTHALFAWLTFHKITDLRASWRGGGHIKYSGSGNWLITIAPYFFPTLPLIAILANQIVATTFYAPAMFVLGATITFHYHSTWVETHSQQPDLIQSGFVFSWLFLPTANLLAILFIVSALPKDGLYAGSVLPHIVEHTQYLFWYLSSSFR